MEPYSVLEQKVAVAGFWFFWRYLFLPLTQNQKKVTVKIPLAGKAVIKNNPTLGRGRKEILKSVTFERKRVSGNRVKP